MKKKNGRNLIEDEPRSSISAAGRRPAIESCGTIIEMRKNAKMGIGKLSAKYSEIKIFVFSSDLIITIIRITKILSRFMSIYLDGILLCGSKERSDSDNSTT